MPDQMSTLVVTTSEKRVEVTVPTALLSEDSLDTLLSNLREREITLPASPVLTKSQGGEMILSERPSFG